jgi:hypothetical protein
MSAVHECQHAKNPKPNPTEHSQEDLSLGPGDWVYLKTLPEDKESLNHVCTGSYQVLLTTPTAISPWVQMSMNRAAPPIPRLTNFQSQLWAQGRCGRCPSAVSMHSSWWWFCSITLCGPCLILSSYLFHYSPGMCSLAAYLSLLVSNSWPYPRTFLQGDFSDFLRHEILLLLQPEAPPFFYKLHV